ncbi:hypothetical protein BD779DRAFT_1238340 [Infundibulicybe gibba]|nr:hypothetical protein BD779DRAFT_1238340 [Infundibulicybe gibba]
MSTGSRIDAGNAEGYTRVQCGYKSLYPRRTCTHRAGTIIYYLKSPTKGLERTRPLLHLQYRPHTTPLIHGLRQTLNGPSGNVKITEVEQVLALLSVVKRSRKVIVSNPSTKLIVGGHSNGHDVLRPDQPPKSHGSTKVDYVFPMVVSKESEWPYI